jgi:hypothetical protein
VPQPALQASQCRGCPRGREARSQAKESGGLCATQWLWRRLRCAVSPLSTSLSGTASCEPAKARVRTTAAACRQGKHKEQRSGDRQHSPAGSSKVVQNRPHGSFASKGGCRGRAVLRTCASPGSRRATETAPHGKATSQRSSEAKEPANAAPEPADPATLARTLAWRAGQGQGADLLGAVRSFPRRACSMAALPEVQGRPIALSVVLSWWCACFGLHEGLDPSLARRGQNAFRGPRDEARHGLVSSPSSHSPKAPTPTKSHGYGSGATVLARSSSGPSPLALHTPKYEATGEARHIFATTAHANTCCLIRQSLHICRFGHAQAAVRGLGRRPSGSRRRACLRSPPTFAAKLRGL